MIGQVINLDFGDTSDKLKVGNMYIYMKESSHKYYKQQCLMGAQIKVQHI